MKDQLLSDEPEKKPRSEVMEEIWVKAEMEFERICGESLKDGEIKSFDDVKRKIENTKVSYEEPEDKWEKARNLGLRSLDLLKMLVGAASLAAQFVPFPSWASNITGNALYKVFDIPEAIKNYSDAINDVFGEVSSALTQLQIYGAIGSGFDPNHLLLRQNQQVLISTVKICAHVVKYRQGRKRGRVWQKAKAGVNHDSGLADEMAAFKQALQQQRDVEGTVTLSVVVETRQDIAMLLEQNSRYGERILKLAQDTHSGVQSLRDDADRVKRLIKIQNTLGVSGDFDLGSNTTQACTRIADQRMEGTGDWIWEHEAYMAWIAARNQDTPHVLLVSGPASSGKSVASALITKRLESQHGRVFVANYFFPSVGGGTIRKSGEEKDTIQSALKSMALQIARVDPTLRNALGESCNESIHQPPDQSTRQFPRFGSPRLDTLWEELKIGETSGATYYLIFDGVPEDQQNELFKFLFDPKLARNSAGRVRVLVSGPDVDKFAKAYTSVEIKMEQHSKFDMRVIINNTLDKRTSLQHAKPGSDQEKARMKIIEKLPQDHAKGSYSLLLSSLDNVIGMLSKRTAIKQLNEMLDQSMTTHEMAIKNLQRSLAADEIKEINELLKWVLYTHGPRNLEQLEAAMFLLSDTESISSLQHIIKAKYGAVFKIENDMVFVKDGIKEYLQKEKQPFSKSSRPEEQPTISMVITINKADQQVCGHFLWDLSRNVIRNQFKFEFDDPSHMLGKQVVIAVDEFEAHRDILHTTFEYLFQEQKEQTKALGKCLLCWLPYHLERLGFLEDYEMGSLDSTEKLQIAQNLQILFKDDKVLRRHKESFQGLWWSAEEIKAVQQWCLRDRVVLRKLDPAWRNKLQADSPAMGYLSEWTKAIVGELVRGRNWKVDRAWYWTEEILKAEDSKKQVASKTSNDDDANTSSSPESDDGIIKTDWNHVSTWCQRVLGLPDSELNSLWYERLAHAASIFRNNEASTILLFQRALESENPSWICYRDMAKLLQRDKQNQDAIAKAEMALEHIRQEDATPKPTEEDILGLNLLLADLKYVIGDMGKALEYYLLVCESKGAEPHQARSAQLGRLKVALSFSDSERTLETLRMMMAEESEKWSMSDVLTMIAKDEELNSPALKILDLSQQDPILLQSILNEIEVATSKTGLAKKTPGEDSDGSDFGKEASRGVLLHARAVAAYVYKALPKESPPETDPVSEALKLWQECLKELPGVRGRNAFAAKRNAMSALANHYFQSMIEGQLRLKHVEDLKELAEGEPSIYYGDAVGFLGALYALREEKSQSRVHLLPRVKNSLQILCDDIPENDSTGFILISQALLQYGDFKNAAVALSLRGQPDFVTHVLAPCLREREKGLENDQLQDMETEMARATIQIVERQVPDSTQQIQRIEVALAHVESLMADYDSQKKYKTSDDDTSFSPGPRGPHLLQTYLQTALRGARHLNSRTFGRYCDGCRITQNDFKTYLYRCIYCCDRDFCENCLHQLLDPEVTVKAMVCNAKHRWLKLPPPGNDMYVGCEAKTVRPPTDVRATGHNEQILEVIYDKDCVEKEVTVEAWKENLAKEWDISIDEIKIEASKPVSAGTA